jgi:adenylate kinase family enzyme
MIGSSGAGKSTFARALAERLVCPLLELDSIYHQPNWTPLPDDEMRARIDAFVAGETWVCDGNYRRFSAPIVARATDLVWLDLPKAIVMTQVIFRSAQRAWSGRPLWNDNRERVSAWLDPDHPIRHTWSNFDRLRRERAQLVTTAELAHLRVHRLRSRRETRAFLTRETRR